MAAVHLIVHGVVQGVGFRQWLKRRAEAEGLSGWCRNRADETVEAVLSGSSETVERVIRDCMSGPLGARVDGLDRSVWTGTVSPGFLVAPTV